MLRLVTVKRSIALVAAVLVVTTVAVAVPTPAPQAATPVVRAAFYYPWYPNAWNQSGVDPFTNYQPSAGYYSSSDPAVIARQIAAMQYGHLDAGISSWWGQGSQEDSLVPAELAAAAGTGFKWSLYYEPEGYGDPSVSQIQSDLSYIKDRYAGNPNYLSIDGKPVIFVYADPADACGMAQRWSQANATEGFYTVLKVFSGYTACASDASSWHQYAPSSAEDHQGGYAFSISPGFYKSGEPAPRLARNLSTWARNVNDMVASNEPLQLVTTFNEWGEGTAVESATAWSSASGYGSYLDVLHAEVPAPTSPSGGGSGGPAPTPTTPGTSSSAPVTISGVATAGTYVWAGAPTANYDGADPLIASFRAYRALLDFTPVVPSGATILNASLTLVPLSGRGGSFVVGSEGPFDHSGVTWATQPPRTGAVLGTSTVPAANVPLTIPLTGLSAASPISLVLSFTTPGVVERFAGVGTSNAPVLTLEYTTPGSGTPAITTTPPPTTTTTPVPTTNPPTTTTTTTTQPGSASAYCGTASGPPTTSKMMVIWEENHSSSAITPSAAPHISAYASACGLATNYQALTHPSLPNYLAATSGLSYASSPWNSDCQASSCTTGNENLYDQVGPSRWKSYAESMPNACQRSNSGEYVSRHNPAVYYTDLGASCATDDVPLGTTAGGSLLDDLRAGTLPTITTVTPNLIDDMHDGTVAQGDAWLSQWIPLITAGPDYRSGRLTVVIAWDEGSGSGNTASTVDAIVMSPYVSAGSRSAVALTHYSLLKAEEDVAGVPELQLAATATDMRTAFGF